MILRLDETARIHGLNYLARRLLPNYRLSWHQLDWQRDEQFGNFLRLFGEDKGLNTYRKWMLWQLLRLTDAVAGDTAECGVYTGASSWLICSANRASPKARVHHLFDSFGGLSAPAGADGYYWTQGDLAVDETLVEENLRPFAGSIEMHKGWIPDRFDDVRDRLFSFVHVDVDLYQPTRDSIEFFYDRLADDAIFLCDDYGFSTCPGATEAVDEFLSAKTEKMISLASGGGFFIKNRATMPKVSPLLPEGT